MSHLRIILCLIALVLIAKPTVSFGQTERMNVLFIISDDLTKHALSCYGNTVCKTPNIDALAQRGTRFTRAYCQGTFCGPSRASLLSGFYPHATGMLGYQSPRPMIGDRPMWPEHFRNHGYHSARVSKIFHMGVPGDIEKGVDGADDPRSWTQRFNSQGPEWQAKGQGETLEGNPDGKRPVVGGNTFVVVQAEGDDLLHSDGKTAQTACRLLGELRDQPFFLAVGFVRPHVPFVAPENYFQSFPFQQMPLPQRLDNDWDDIPKPGINYKTSRNMKMNLDKQRKAIAGYYASVTYMDAQVGKVMQTLTDEGLDQKTIVIFTSDHGYHLGEHDFWAKVSLHEESATVPLIICVPGKEPAVCDSLTELLDLYPTVSSLCGLPYSAQLQGKDISPMLDDPSHQVRDAALIVNGKGFLLRSDRYAYMRYGEGDGAEEEFYDMQVDPRQWHNQIANPMYSDPISQLRQQLKEKLIQVRDHSLPVGKQAPAGSP